MTGRLEWSAQANVIRLPVDTQCWAWKKHVEKFLEQLKAELAETDRAIAELEVSDGGPKIADGC